MYPNARTDEKKALFEKQFQSVLQNNKKDIDKAVRLVRSGQKNDLLRFYLLESDPYFYLQLTTNIISTGKISPKIKDGKYWHPLMMAPYGHWRLIELHPYIGYITYKLYSLFSPGVSIIFSLATVPVIFFCLSMLLFFMICRVLNIPNFIAFISSFFFSLSPIFLQRSAFGWFDTDPYNVFLLLLAVFLLLKLIMPGEKHSVVYLVLLSLASAVYSLMWQGWLIVPLLMSIVFVCLTIRGLSARQPGPFLRYLFIYWIITPTVTAIFLTPSGFMYSTKDILDIFSGFLFLKSAPWPDIFLTVGELNVPSMIKIFHLLGGILLLPLSVLGTALLFLKALKDKHAFPELSLAVLFTTCFLFSKTAQRFVLFLLPVASLCFACALNELWHFLKSLKTLPEKHMSYLTKVLSAALLVSLAMPITYAHVSSYTQLPLFNTVWQEALESIKNNTPAASIINTWWPPGHFIKSIAERRVVFDGATINTPQAYWMSLFLLDNNEKRSLRILRMLNLSGNRATEILLENGLDISNTVNTIRAMSEMDKGSAKKFLKSILIEDKTVDEILPLMYGPPPPAYCFLYNDLVEGTLGLCYVKNWDFSKALDLEKKRYTEFKKGNFLWRGSQNNVSSVWSISGGMPYLSGEMTPLRKENDVIIYPNGVMLNTKLMEAFINNLENKVSGIPESIIYLNDTGEFTEKLLKNSNLRLSLILIPYPAGYNCIVGPRTVLTSMLFRLYYLKGSGLKCFEKFGEVENPILKTKIIIYKINWPGSE